MKIFFGNLFVGLAIILTLIQAFSFAYDSLNEISMILLLILSIGSLLGSIFILDEEKLEKKKYSAAIALLYCAYLIVHIAVLVLDGTFDMTGWEYLILTIYALIFGLYGFKALEIFD